MTDEWPETFLLIHQSHDQVYRTIDAAIHDEEQENPQSAIINYRLVIVQIDEAMTIPVQVPEDPVELDDTWRKACQMIHKMKCTRGEVVQRINSLMTKYPPPKLDITANAATAPLNESASDDQSRPRTYAELAIALQNIQSIEQRSDECLNDALQLIYTCNNVRFYRIGSNGDVTTTTENCELRVLSLEADTKRQLQNTYFMQIISEAITGSEATNAIDAFDNPWIYPLKAGASPCYYTKFGAFMFPDLHADDIEFGAAIGIVVPKESEHLVLEILEAILHGVVRQLTDADLALMRSRRSSSEVVSDNIVKGATYLSQGLVCGSNKIGQFMTNNTPYLISKLERVPENAPPVSERVVTGVQVAKNVTTAAVGVTGYVAGKIGSATMALGRFLAPHVHTQGSKLLSHTMGFSQEEAAEKVRMLSLLFVLQFPIKMRTLINLDERCADCSRWSRRRFRNCLLGTRAIRKCTRYKFE